MQVAWEWYKSYSWKNSNSATLKSEKLSFAKSPDLDLLLFPMHTCCFASQIFTLATVIVFENSFWYDRSLVLFPHIYTEIKKGCFGHWAFGRMEQCKMIYLTDHQTIVCQCPMPKVSFIESAQYTLHILVQLFSSFIYLINRIHPFTYTGNVRKKAWKQLA